MLLGKTQKQLGQPNEAAATFRRILTSDPDSLAALVELGALLVEYNDPAHAILHLQKALQLKPALPEALLSMGWAMMHLSRFIEA